MKIRYSIFFVALALTGGALAQKAAETSRDIWQQVELSKYENRLPDITAASTWRSLISMLPGCLAGDGIFNPDHLTKTFTHSGDVMPQGRTKDIHGFGTTIKVKWIAETEHPYTGIFSSGAEYGVARFSLAKPPTEENSTPGMGLKIFVDDKESVNIMAMYSLDGQTSHHIFANDFSNVLGKPAPGFINDKLNEAFTESLRQIGDRHGSPRELSIEHFARLTSDGTTVQEVQAPYRLIFRPTEAVKSLMQDDFQQDFRAQLEGKGEKVTLYAIFATHKLENNRESEPKLIGHLLGDSPFIASEFGDKHLFFRHFNKAAKSIQESGDL